ncbi:MAG TPA: hypothetical protein VI385_10280 [Flavisolibacter sp.]
MKRVFLFSGIAAVLLSCNSSDTKTADETKMGETKVAAMSTNDLAFPLKDWGDWQPGSMDNLKVGLQSLKDFQMGNVDACMNAFGDSVELRFDGMIGKYSKDSATKFFKNLRASMKNIDINMDDYETVKSKDGKEEWVSMWYKQKTTDDKGKLDSIVCMDDMKFSNGKIVLLDEKLRRLPKK